MRVVLLTHGGADLVIERLSGLAGIEMAGVFVESVAAPIRTPIEKLKRSIKYNGLAGTAAKLIRRGGRSNATAEGRDLTRDAAARFGVPVVDVENYHTDNSISLLRSARADLAVIFGTNIIKESVFSIPILGSINLHQGLAPLYRGGPPVFWELFNGEDEVGLTVHFVAGKVDTGDIVLQSRVPLHYNPVFQLDFESFIDDFRSRLREHSARLVADAVGAIAANDFQRSPQDITQGKRYRLPTKREKDELRRRLKERLSRGGR